MENLFFKFSLWVNPRKIHKLKLTNCIGVLLAAFFKTAFGRLRRSIQTERLEDAFRRHFAVKHAIVFPHARIALHYILKAMDLEAGSEVIMTPLTIADMVNSIHTLGLKPVFVDIELDTFSIDTAALKKVITARSRVILVTHLFGIVPDMKNIKEIANEYGLKIIEDCSQAFDGLCYGQKVGTFGEGSFFSLSNFKICSSLFGGMFITNNSSLAGRCKEFRDSELLTPCRPMLLKMLIKNLVYGVFFSRWLFCYFTYFIILLLENIDPRITYRLYTGNIKILLGIFENRLLRAFPREYLSDYTDTQAWIGLKSLEDAEHATVSRTMNGERLRKLLKDIADIRLPCRRDFAVNVYWRFPIISSDAEGLRRYLLRNGIDSGPTYLTLCSSEAGFEPYHASTPNAKIAHSQTLLLEVNEDLNDRDIDRTASLIIKYSRDKI